MIRILLTLIALLFATISIAAQDDTASEDTTLYIAPYTQPCTGVGLQDCLIVRFEDDSDLSYFYADIEGFEFDAGNAYILRVRITERDDVPADASSLQYTLLEIIQQYPAEITDRIWELQSLGETIIDDPTRYTFITTDEGTSIKADCNQVMANLSLAPFTIETTASTLAMCPPDSLESEYIAALNTVNLLSIENGELILQTPETTLRFAPPTIGGTIWQLQSVATDDDTLTIEDVRYTLSLEEDLARMVIACNNAAAAITRTGAVLSMDEIETEEELCLDDPLDGQFPPQESMLHTTATGDLILTASDGTRYRFAPTVEA